jgi:hypothetical protein
MDLHSDRLLHSVRRAYGAMWQAALMAALLLLAPQVVDACPICFQGVESPLLDATRLGVLTMAFLTVCVLVVVGRWCRRLARWEAESVAAEHSTR